jgi:photosystem II stability/assembly factor-like uncharacterized protein
MPSDNILQELYEFPEMQNYYWYTAKAINNDKFLLGGIDFNTMKGIINTYKDSSAIRVLGSDPISAIDALDEARIFAGTSPIFANNKSKVYKTIDAGSTWDSTDVSGITRSVYALKFIDNSYGLIVGSSLNSKFGVGLTFDAGKQWAFSPNIPAPNTSETVNSVKAVSFIDELCWFGTNKGRILSTKDFGKSWQQTSLPGNPNIYFVKFIDANNAIVLYSNPTGAYKLRAASTNDAGVTWTMDRYNFTDMKLTPVYMFVPPSSNQLSIVCNDGQVLSTDDYGNTWKPILSKKVGSVAVGAGVGSSQTARLWNADSKIFYLEYEYMPSNPKKALSLETSASINFGFVNIGDTSTSFIEIRNVGNIKSVIDSVVIRPDTASTGVFDSDFTSTKILKVDELFRLKISYLPSDAKLNSADILVYNNAISNPIKVRLRGNGKKVVGVNDRQEQPINLLISPNPCYDFLNISFDNNIDEDCILTIFNLNGRQIDQTVSNLKTGYNLIRYETSKLLNGNYNFELRSKTKFYKGSFILIK